MSSKQKSIEERMKSRVLTGDSALFPKKVSELGQSLDKDNPKPLVVDSDPLKGQGESRGQSQDKDGPNPLVVDPDSLKGQEEGQGRDKDGPKPPEVDSDPLKGQEEAKGRQASGEHLKHSTDTHPGLTIQDEIEALNNKMGGGNALQGAVYTQNMNTSNAEMTQPVPYKVKHFKKERLIDTHTQRSYYIENEIALIIEELAGDDTGFKYRFVNEAIRLLIHQEYPHLVNRLRPQ
ncbi:hypothetical protein HGO21_16485 [Acinetobacter sp. CUI P1]|nr:hypothetical protein [Acinetobacter sp. CUI P1]